MNAEIFKYDRPTAMTAASAVKRAMSGAAKRNTTAVPKSMIAPPYVSAVRTVSAIRAKSPAPLFWATIARVAVLRPMAGRSMICSIRMAAP
jgi:hypothetical protein